MKASAPASSANLGPGFDSLGLALEIRCTVEVATHTEWSVVPKEAGEFVEAAARKQISEPLSVTIQSAIPIERGLGSSAALLTALHLAISRLQGSEDDPAEMFRAVSAAEGHPDNAAAAVYGGFVHVSRDRVDQLQLHDSWTVLVAVPEARLSTPEARSVLPDSVPFDVAARTTSRAVRLVEAARTGDVDMMRSVGRDEFHEPHRARLQPSITRMLDAGWKAGAPHMAISGAGPAVLAIVDEASEAPVSEALATAVGDGVLLTPGVARTGVR